METRTGKTAVEILDFSDRFAAGSIDAVLVCAPNGVHSNWVRREIPRHMPEGVAYRSATYSSGAQREERDAYGRMISAEPGEPRTLRILAISWDAMITKEGFSEAKKFCARFAGRLKIVADESQRVKNPSARRTKALFKLRPFSRFRSIMSGTPILNSPFDAFSQFSFLHESILRTTSYTAFKSEYAEMLPPGVGLMRHIQQRIGANRPLPQVVARDADGRPKWRNLDRLEALLAPHAFRILRKDCLDLPAQIRTQRFFRMTPRQRQAYELLRDEFRLELANGQTTATSRIGSYTKLSQITSGYFLVPGTEIVQRIMPLNKNPKIEILKEELETLRDAGKPILIWARFQAEQDDIAVVLREMGIRFAEYHGRVKKSERQPNIDRFQRGEVDAFLSQQSAGGVGLTLNAGKAQIYYSNTFKLEDRLQSIDRTEGIGQTDAVDVVDLLAEDSIDETMLDVLSGKEDLASVIVGDARRAAALLR